MLTRSTPRVPGGGVALDAQAALPIIRRLLTVFGARYWRRYAFAFVLMAIASANTALIAYLIGEVVNQTFQTRSYDMMFWLAGAVATVFILRGVATYGQAVALARVANAITAENQRRFFQKVLSERLGFVTERHSSEFLARMQAGATSAGLALNVLITAVGRDVLTLIGLLAVMAYQDPVLTLVSVLVAPPAVLVLRKLVRRVKSVAYSQFQNNARVLQTQQEILQGIRIVKAFTLEQAMLQRAYANIDEIEKASNKLARVSNRSGPLMESLGGIVIAVVILYAGHRVVGSGATPGALVSFLTAFLLAYEPAKRLAQLNINISGALVGVRALFDVLDGDSGERDAPGLPPLRIGEARIAFRDVRFAYRDDEPVLRGLSFVAEPGRVTALVGPSGSGKSTVLNLLLRFYDPGGGEIAIDGQDIAAVTRASLRQQLAYVGQDTFLFAGSIRENIALGRLGASDAEIEAAAKAAFAHDFIVKSPRSYDTPVGEHGLQLSGGQRQRIAIARALIKDAPIILLDEATAALDAESERAVQQALARLCEGRTTLMIAHRLGTIMHADSIHVIEQGEVVESGQHHDLLRRGGRYAQFHRLQLEKQADPASGPEASPS